MKLTCKSLLIILLLGTGMTASQATETDLLKAQEKIALLEQENQDLKSELQALEQNVSELQQALDDHQVEQLKAEMEQDTVED